MDFREFVSRGENASCSLSTRVHIITVMMSAAQLEKAFKAWPQVEPALRVPRNERQYRELVRLLDALIDRVGEDEDHPLASMMEVLGVLIEKYEEQHIPELI